MMNTVFKFANNYGIGLAAYMVVGFVSALTEWSTFAVSLSFMAPVPAAACVGFVVATLLNFALSRRYVLHSRRSGLTEAALVILVSGAVFACNIGVFYMLYAFLLVPVMAAKILGTAAGFICNFTARQFWIFSSLPRHAPLSSLSTRYPARRANDAS
jgi:putative flippase GtrA